MYRYKIFLDEGLLLVKFYGEYIAEEGDSSVLDICRSMDIDARYAIKTVIWDLQDVTAMTLVNTDVARGAHFDKELLEIFERPGIDAAEHFKTVHAYHVQPDNSAIADIFRERLTRVSRGIRKTPLVDGKKPRGLTELLESLGLSKILPLLDGEWQK